MNPWESDPLLPLYRAIAADRPDKVTQEAMRLLQELSREEADLRRQHKTILLLVAYADQEGAEAAGP